MTTVSFSPYCPISGEECPTFSTPRAMAEHLLSSHDSRVVAERLVREVILNTHMHEGIFRLSGTVEGCYDRVLRGPIFEEEVHISPYV